MRYVQGHSYPTLTSHIGRTRRPPSIRRIDSYEFARITAEILTRMTGETCVAQPHEAGGYKLVRLTGSKMVRG